MPRLALLALSVVLPISGAGTLTALAQGTAEDPENRRTTSQNVEWNLTIVWDRIRDFLERRNDFDLISVDRENWMLTAERSGVNDTGWVTCDGSRPTEQVDMRVDVELLRGTPGLTNVTISTYAVRDGEPLQGCRPTGELTQMLLDAL